jgi:hypothetical protein
MGFMTHNRFGDPSLGMFDPATTVDQLRAAFPEIRLLPGDQLALSADRAEAGGFPDLIVRTLRRNQQEYGPAYAFEIDLPEQRKIRGNARRYDVTFLFDDSLDEDWRQRLSDFLHSLGGGRREGAAAQISTSA